MLTFLIVAAWAGLIGVVVLIFVDVSGSSRSPQDMN